jgi:uncharacterized membrane protein YoaK (UPF0700 family)
MTTSTAQPDSMSPSPAESRDRPSADEIRNREQALPILLSFVAAFIDVICYLALFRTFTAFVTGTLIILATELIHEDGETITKFVVIGTFMVSLVVWVALIRLFAARRHLRSVLFAIEAALLTLFMIAGSVLSPLRASDAPETTVVAVIAVLAMSLQNAIMALIMRAHVPTTVMTGNLTRFVISTVDIFGFGGEDARNDPEAAFKTRRQLLHYVYVLAAFMLGAVAGAFGFHAFGFYAVACPVAILALLSVLAVDRRQ